MKHSTQATLSRIAATGLRICVGVIFLVHGWDKFSAGIPATTDWLEELGVEYAALAAPVVIGAELLAGAALVVGLATRFAALVLLIHTGLAWFLVHRGHGFFVAEGGSEHIILLAVALTGIALSGSAGTGVDRLLARRR